MAFWSDVGIDNITEPKRKYRWLAYIGGLAPWVCKKVTKPEFEVTETPHQYLNHEFYYPGRVKWSTVTVTLVDPQDPDMAQTFWNGLVNSGYHPPEDPGDTTTISKAGAVSQLGNKVRIVMLGSTDLSVKTGGQQAAGAIGADHVIEEWQLYNPWVKKVSFGELDYSSDDMVEVTVEIRYDYAKLNQANADNMLSVTPNGGEMGS
jgi:hypothetical protein